LAPEVQPAAQNLCIKIFATKVPIVMQTQIGLTSLVGLQDMKLESADDRLVLTAAKEV